MLPRTILLVPLMVYESTSFLPGLVFAMRSEKGVLGNVIFFSCCLVKGEEEEEQKNPKLRVGGGVGWVGGILFSCEERE